MVRSCFRAGFSSPRLKWPAAGLGLSFLVLIALEISLRAGALTRLPLTWQLRSDVDQFVSIQNKIGRLNAQINAAERIYLLGGSAVRESVEDPEELARKINRLSSRRVEVIGLTSMLQTFAESMAIIDNLPPGRGTLLLGVSPGRFSLGMEDWKRQAAGRGLLLPSPSLIRFMKQWKMWDWRVYSVLPAFFFQLREFLQTNHTALVRGEFPQFHLKAHYYDGAPYPTEAKRNRDAEGYVVRYETNFRPNLAFNFAAIDRLVEVAKAKGLKLILLESPMARPIQTKLKSQIADYTSRIRTYSTQRKIPYWDFIWNLDIADSDYYDLVHLVKSGRQKFESALLQKIAAQSSEVGAL